MTDDVRVNDFEGLSRLDLPIALLSAGGELPGMDEIETPAAIMLGHAARQSRALERIADALERLAERPGPQGGDAHASNDRASEVGRGD